MAYLLVKPNGEFEDVIINNFKDIKRVIGGNFALIPASYFRGSGLNAFKIGAFCDDEGKLKDLEDNLMFEYDMVVGNVLFFEYDKEGDDKDLSLTNKNKIKKWVLQNHMLRDIFSRVNSEEESNVYYIPKE